MVKGETLKKSSKSRENKEKNRKMRTFFSCGQVKIMIIQSYRSLLFYFTTFPHRIIHSVIFILSLFEMISISEIYLKGTQTLKLFKLHLHQTTLPKLFNAFTAIKIWLSLILTDSSELQLIAKRVRCSHSFKHWRYRATALQTLDANFFAFSSLHRRS